MSFAGLPQWVLGGIWQLQRTYADRAQKFTWLCCSPALARMPVPAIQEWLGIVRGECSEACMHTSCVWRATQSLCRKRSWKNSPLLVNLFVSHARISVAISRKRNEINGVFFASCTHGNEPRVRPLIAFNMKPKDAYPPNTLTPRLTYLYIGY